MKTLKKYYKSFIFSLIINVVFLLIVLVLFKCQFQNNDDVTMRGIITGEYGRPDIHTVYINVIYSFFLKCLYSLWSNICWYEIVLYAFMIICFSSLSCLICNISKNIMVSLSLVLSLLLFSVNFYTHVQYTKVAGLLAMTGMVVASYVLNYEKNNYVICFPVLFLTLGSWLRFKQAIVCVFLCGWLFLPFVKDFVKEFFNKCLSKCSKSFLLFVALCLLIIGSSYFIDKLSYSGKEWQNYNYYNMLRTELLDDGTPDYSVSAQLYDSYCGGPSGFRMINNWIHYDTEVFNTGTLYLLVDAKGSKEINQAYVMNFLSDTATYFIKNTGFVFYLLLTSFSILYFTISAMRKSDYLTALWAIAAFIFVMFYSYYIRANMFIEHTSMCFLFSSFVSMLYYILINDICSINKGMCFVLILFIIIGYFSTNWNELRKYENVIDASTDKMLTEILDDKEHLYLSSVSWLANRNALFSTKKYNFENYIPLGGWLVESPYCQAILERYNIVNPLKDLVDNEDIYVITTNDSNYISLIQDFIYSNHHIATKAELVNEHLGYYQIYKFISEQ